MSDLSGYSSPLLSIWNQQSKQIKNENITVYNSSSVLQQIPDPDRKVQIQNFSECTDDRVLSGNLFRVDYDTGVLSFGSNIADGTNVNVASYYGRGVILLPGKRIYVDSTNPDVPTNIQDLIDNYNNLNGVDLYTKFDPNAGHDHSGTAGNGPQLSANNIMVQDSHNVFNSYNVEDTLYELDQEISTNGNKISINSGNTGDLSNLKTSNQSNVVSAINENNNNISANTKQITDGRGGFSTLKDKLNSYAVNVIDFGATGSDKTTTGSITSGSTQLNVNSIIDFEIGHEIAIESAGSGSTYEVVSLQITNGAINSGNVTVTLDGSPTNIPVISGNTDIQVADQIRNTTFSGWSTGGSSGTNIVTFTANTYGDKINATYNSNTTGVSGNINTTTQGYSDLFVSTIAKISGNIITISDQAQKTVSGIEVRHDDTNSFKNAFDTAIDGNLAIYIPFGTFNISSPLDVTRRNSDGVAGSQYGRMIFGEGYHSTIVYYPYKNTTSISAPDNGYAAGAINGGNDGSKMLMKNFRVILGGSNRNNACGLKLYKVYQSIFENIQIEGFEVGIHMNYNWSNNYRNNKLYNNGIGLLLDNMTINHVENNDINNCDIGILYGWNITGTNTGEPQLYSQGMTLMSNTIQNCSECAIFGFNTQVTNIIGSYTQGNCSSTSFDRTNNITSNETKLNGCEIIIDSNNPDGSSFVNIEGNWFWQNQSVSNQSPLGLKNVSKINFKSNSVYNKAYSQGVPAVKIITLGSVSSIKSDVIVLGGIYDSEQFYRNAMKTINNIPLVDLTSSNVSIPANSTQTIITPISLYEPNVTDTVKLDSDMTSLSGLSFRVGIYSGWESKLINSFSGTSQSGTLDTSRKTITMPLGQTITMPQGLQWIAIEITNTTASAIAFSFLTKTGFDYTRGDIGSSVLNGSIANFVSANKLNVSSVIQPFSINVSG